MRLTNTGTILAVVLTSGRNSGVLGKVLLPTAFPSIYRTALLREWSMTEATE